MKLFLIALLLQIVVPVPPRIAMENPAAVSPVPPKAKKDYDKLWSQFLTAKEDAKLVKELDKFLRKQKNSDAAIMIQAYLELHKRNNPGAAQKFEQVLAIKPDHRIAQYYLAELLFASGDYGRANSLFEKLLAADKTRTDLEMKRQKALLLATENLLRSAATAEKENRLTDAEAFYRQALSLAPKEPILHARLADLLLRANKKEEAAAERKIAEELTPRRNSTPPAGSIDEAQVSELEDRGRWGTSIETFRQIRSAEAITREQLAALIVRYFPQVTESRPPSRIITDIDGSWASSEIRTVVGIGLMDPLPNHSFEPSSKVTRSNFALAMGRLIRLLDLPVPSSPPIPLTDLAPASVTYPEVQLALSFGLLPVEESGNFNAGGQVSGKEAVAAAERLLRSFQQVKH
jgi:tetratricopeptide (TPR) repeat protein